MYETLINVGFSPEESRIYFCLLDRKNLSVAEIAKFVGIKRTTCYSHVQDMLRKDYIVKVPKGKKYYFSPVPPKSLAKRFKNYFLQLENETNNMQAKYENASSAPKVTFFEGKQGIKDIYRESFETVGDASSIFPADEYFENFTYDEFLESEKTLADTKFRSKDIILASKSKSKVKKALKFIKNKSKTYKVLDKSTLKTSVDVLIFGKKVALISLKRQSAVVIEDSEIVEFFASIHENLWKTLK